MTAARELECVAVTVAVVVVLVVVVFLWVLLASLCRSCRTSARQRCSSSSNSRRPRSNDAALHMRLLKLYFLMIRLFCEFCNLGAFTKIKGHKYYLQRYYY